MTTWNIVEKKNPLAWLSGCGGVEIELTQDQVDSVCHPGPNDLAVQALPRPDLDPDKVRKVLREYGAWDDDELRDNAANLQRILWIACWDCYEEPDAYRSAA